MALPLPTDDDAELFADLLASLQTLDAPVQAESVAAAAGSSSSPPSPLSLEGAAPTAATSSSAELLDGDAAELLDALCEPVLALDDCLALYGDGTASVPGGGGVTAAVGAAGAVGGDAVAASAAKSDKSAAKKRTRRSNPNKAREEQRRELLALRVQAAALEQQVGALQARSVRTQLAAARHRHDGRSAHGGGEEVGERAWAGAGLAEVWRQTCVRQLERRVRAERENARLKRALASQLATTSAIRSMLDKPSSDSASAGDAAEGLKRRRTGSARAPPEDPAADEELFARLIDATDASVERIDAFLQANDLVDVDTPRRGAQVREVDGRLVLDVFATSVLPYDWRFAKRGVWHFYKGAQKHFGPVFDKKAQSVGRNADTVLESFVMELLAANARADFHIRQAVKRYAQAEQQVIAWALDSHPVEASSSPISFGFRESGFVVCRPPRAWAATATNRDGTEAQAAAAPPVTVMQIGYRISPYLTGPRGRQRSLRASIDDIARFLFSSLDAEIRAKLERIEDLLLADQRAA